MSNESLGDLIGSSRHTDKCLSKQRHVGIHVAAFQFEAVHEDVAAGFFRAFSQLGLSCRGYFNQRIRESRGDFFDLVRHRGVHVSYVPFNDREDWKAVLDEVQRLQPRFLFLNSFQRDGIARWAATFSSPILGVVHNPTLFTNSAPCVELARNGRAELFVLAPHVASKLRTYHPELAHRIHVHFPYEWMMDDEDGYSPAAGTLDVVVSGAVNFRNRDFRGLLDHLDRGEARAQRPFRLWIVAGGPDRAALESASDARGLGHYFRFLPLDPVTGRVPHAEYLRALYRCHAVLPLLPEGRVDYVTSKISTGIAAAVGTGRPIISTSAVAEAYGFVPIELPRGRPFAIGECDLTQRTLEARRAETLALRQRGLDQNFELLAKLTSEWSSPST